MFLLDNPTSICNKRRVYLLYKTNFDDIMGYSEVTWLFKCLVTWSGFEAAKTAPWQSRDSTRYTFLLQQAQFLAIFEENEWRRIESQVCMYLFNDLAQYFFSHSIIISLFIACYMNIFEFYSIFFTQLLIRVIYYLPPLLMFLCCLLASNPGHLFCYADTLLLGYWILWSFAYILYIRYIYVLTYF